MGDTHTGFCKKSRRVGHALFQGDGTGGNGHHIVDSTAVSRFVVAAQRSCHGNDSPIRIDFLCSLGDTLRNLPKQRLVVDGTFAGDD